MAIPQPDNPLELFHQWFDEAKRCDALDEPTAMSLATVNEEGMPSVRIVLLKDASPRGFTFYTNLESDKARHLRENPAAALCFYWPPLEKQIRIQGRVELVEEAEADAYFQSRPRESRIGAWASRQSRPLEDRFALEKRVALYTAKFGLGEIPRPPFWSGFRLVPQRIEFWLKKPFRLHERLRYHRGEGDEWTTERLYP